MATAYIEDPNAVLSDKEIWQIGLLCIQPWVPTDGSKIGESVVYSD